VDESTRAYFVPEDGGLRPVPEAHSPWAEEMLHGRLLSGLAARAVEQEPHDPALRLARLTLDMFRSPPMDPFTYTTEVLRDGRRVRVLDVSISSNGLEVARARALMARTGDGVAGDAWRPPAWDAPDPEALDTWRSDVEPGATEEMGWDIRLVSDGGFWSADRKRVWTRDRWRLVAGEDLSPSVRAALAADLPNPLANAGSQGLSYINPDLTLFLARPPVSAWIGLEVSNHVAADGVAVGECVLYDLEGPIGSSTVCAVTNPATLSG
jgi:acyl-CoA thioesterase